MSIGLSLMSMSPGPYQETLDAIERVFSGTFFTGPEDAEDA